LPLNVLLVRIYSSSHKTLEIIEKFLSSPEESENKVTYNQIKGIIVITYLELCRRKEIMEY
jgi:hypothetical protein